jgi:hypothetical protein
MGLAGTMALAGAVRGIGQTMLQRSEEQKQRALLELKRRWQLEDEARKMSGRTSGGLGGSGSAPKPFKLTEAMRKKAETQAASDGLIEGTPEYRQAVMSYLDAYEKVSTERPDVDPVMSDMMIEPVRGPDQTEESWLPFGIGDTTRPGGVTGYRPTEYVDEERMRQIEEMAQRLGLTVEQVLAQMGGNG